MTRRAAVLAGLLGALLAVLGGTRTWVRVPDVTVVGDVTVSGREAAPVVVAVALAAAVGALVLGTAGRAGRYAVGALLLLAGVAVVLGVTAVTGDPGSAAGPALSRATGVLRPQGLPPAEVTVWPWLSLGGGVVVAAAGLLTLVTARSWPAAGRRFERPDGDRPEAAQAHPADSWDALSRGEDPTG